MSDILDPLADTRLTEHERNLLAAAMSTPTRDGAIQHTHYDPAIIRLLRWAYWHGFSDGDAHGFASGLRTTNRQIDSQWRS